jgi:NADH:ubiquinone oxidoreductase subunit 3 (subunit A)
MMATILGIMQAGVGVVVVISVIVVLLVVIALTVRAIGHHRENKAKSPSAPHGGNGPTHDRAA